MTAPPTDRRVALKERHRRAIVEAAAALTRETGGTSFTVEQLAERADVSRRTVFNHFASMEDVVTAVCVDVLRPAVDDFASGPQGSPAPGGATLLDELAELLRTADLVTPLSYLTRVVGAGGARTSPRQAQLMLRAASDVSERLSAQMARRHPEVDPFDVDVLIASLIGGLAVIQRRWADETGASDDPESRRVWSALVDRLIQTARGSSAGPPHDH